MRAIAKYLVIIVLSFGLVVSTPAITNAQIPFLSSSSSTNGESTFTPWWKMSKVRVCGKLLCTNVNFPYFPYDVFGDNKFTIASRTDLQDPQKTSDELEIRAGVVEQTLLSLYRRVVRNNAQKTGAFDQKQSQEISLQDWLLFKDKPLHPLTPKVEVGTKNAQTIIFTPTQPELGLSQETIITITEDDSIYNGRPVEELARQWRQIIHEDLSEALWGNEFDRIFPAGRLQIIVMIFVLTLVPIILLTIFGRLIRNLDRQLRYKIRELNELAKLEQQASFLNPSDSPDTISEGSEQILESLDEKPPQDRQQEITNNTATKSNNLDKKVASIRKVKIIFNRLQGFIITKINNLLARSPTVSLTYQNIVKQLKNLTRFLLQLLIWLRVLFLFAGLALMVCVYPNTRIASFFFIAQAIFLPLIWMSVNLLDTIVSFVIDYYLNRWAQEGQIAQPNSNRYALRVTTYSPALKGASSFVFTIIGIVLTIELLGIDTSVLAGAGGAALLVGFLGRNVLEDMLNGVLILWTDRYAIGDIITVGAVGGFVENMNLYNTQIRGAGGCLITVPNGQISLVENKTKDWSRTEFKIEISAKSDPLKAIRVLQEVGEQMQQDADWQEAMLEPVNILGIDQVSHQGIIIQVWIKTQPMKQFSIGREFRLRVLQAFTKAEIELGMPQRQVWHIEPSAEDHEAQSLA
ncbi:mechanosensitive ion channel family protein [Xenococcus sp. PCC 7305]|uniref:mechanosensitive ion channel family protein n=1 Tax=Xenococcus sp. PCC 7305 TaxID=102125 RepID=UPI00068CE21E|nr:mechanosensitive ion channel family protein [Xenococcus sp. PCC 7305]